MNNPYWIALYGLVKAIQTNLAECPEPVQAAFVAFQAERDKD